jgi:hypothetical protein
MSLHTRATIFRRPDFPSCRSEVSARALQAAGDGRYYEWGGGLGDVIGAATHSEIFDQLDRAQGEKLPIVVVLISHNPHSWELFGLHPNAHVLTIVDLPFKEVQGKFGRFDDGFRSVYGLPAIPPKDRPWLYPDGVLRFWSTADDIAVLSSVPERRIVFSATASLGPNDVRNIPWRILKTALQVVREEHFTPVFVGRNYNINGSTSPHKEGEVPAHCAPVDLTDRLTVPGVLELVRKSAATIACDSAVGCGAHALMRPTFSLVADDVWKACRGPEAGHGEILDPRFYQSSYGAYTDDLLRQFLRRHTT